MGPARAALALTLCGLSAVALAEDDPVKFDFGGHIKARLLSTSYPDNSFFDELIGSNGTDLNADTRLHFGLRRRGWDAEADLQLIALYGDTIEATQKLPPALQLLTGRIPLDITRLFDLTHVFTDEGDFVALGRFDRLSVGYTGDRDVVRFGRQAITWGNGLIWSPMDIFNPFDPAAVDKEFKTGDDMLYGQHLWASGDDLQGVLVPRRNPVSRDVEADFSSLAIKYHGLVGLGEFDALAARHFGDTLVGAGGNRSIGGAVWRGDLILTYVDADDLVATAVTSISHSHTWGGKNVSGVLEYFYNGFGQSDGDYDPASLAQNTELLRRVARGELFTLGRHYIGVSTLIEVTPLFQLTPILFTNITDPSALLQIVTQNDLRQNLLLLGALNVPIGADETEFGGIPTGAPGVFLSSGPAIFVQIAWYF